ncbi:MAG: hydroxymyristoyl-ACP dehydratase [Burkholderiaceae bacterium]|nr:hydroxymyristoyl-ACP dehydratase [Burkholderiaceae bacterium]
MLTALDPLLPHAGRMRLIAAVRAWDAVRIECVAHSHRDANHPLAIDGVLPAVCGLEYGAQAMAIHGALVAGARDKPQIGLLVAAHDLRWSVPRLDTVAEDLIVQATRLLGSSTQVAYEFALRAGARVLVSGRASVLLRVTP